MRRSRADMKVKILLDTSFLLPIVGVRVREVEDLLDRLWAKHRRGEVEIYYTELNILEIAWKLSKIHYDPMVVKKGLMSIERNFVKAPLKYTSLLKAIELRRKNFKDLIDLMLYAIAAENNLQFLTLDEELINFLEGVGEDINIIITTL
ncbi:MAG: PIN domain-containing protein [Sulfolobales archaeon]